MTLKYDFEQLFYERLSKPMLDHMITTGVVDFSNHYDPNRVALSLLNDAVQHQHPATELILDHFNVPQKLELEERIVFFQLVVHQ